MPWKANILPLLRMTDFANFTASFDKDAGGTGSPFGIHGAGHSGVGGEVSLLSFFRINTFISPIIPLVEK
jgi:hypothetical protein